VAFAGAAHRFRGNMHLDRFLGTVRLHRSAEPTNMPCLMSAIVEGAIATYSGLSVTVSFNPRRHGSDHINRTIDTSMVPRMRTVSSAAEAGKIV